MKTHEFRKAATKWITGERLEVSLAFAYLLFALADFVMYFGLFWVLVKSFKYYRFGVIGFSIVVAPFAFLLSTCRSLVDLLWMLFFTPFYGLIVMLLAFPFYIALYYAISYGVFVAFCLATKKGRKQWRVR